MTHSTHTEHWLMGSRDFLGKAGRKNVLIIDPSKPCDHSSEANNYNVGYWLLWAETATLGYHFLKPLIIGFGLNTWSTHT